LKIEDWDVSDAADISSLTSLIQAEAKTILDAVREKAALAKLLGKV